jgi:hypothetical protein
MSRSQIGVILCPGLRGAEDAPGFWQAIQAHRSSNENAQPSVIILPRDCPVYSPKHVYHSIEPDLKAGLQRWIWIAYSAGVVGALGAARRWHEQFPVHAFIALDGWGVPLAAPFPVYHLSHDWLTHLGVTFTNRLAGTFYAEPAVSHLELWRSPQMVTGWESYTQGDRHFTTAAAFVAQLIDSFGVL